MRWNSYDFLEGKRDKHGCKDGEEQILSQIKYWDVKLTKKHFSAFSQLVNKLGIVL